MCTPQVGKEKEIWVLQKGMSDWGQGPNQGHVHTISPSLQWPPCMKGGFSTRERNNGRTSAMMTMWEKAEAQRKAGNSMWSAEARGERKGRRGALGTACRCLRRAQRGAVGPGAQTEGPHELGQSDVTLLQIPLVPHSSSLVT